jgi:hypothetical protein
MPAGLAALREMMSAPHPSAARVCAIVCTWQISRLPAARIARANGEGSPNDSISTSGACESARSSNSGCFASDQVMNPQPMRAFPAAANSRSSQSASP